MKTHLLLLSLLATSLMHITAQTTIQLTFTAEVNGIHQPLDSILIQNLTQGGDTTLYGTDTVLVLNHGIGIEYMEGHRNQMFLHPAFPNPVTHTSTIRLWLPQHGPVVLKLYDLVGRELAMFSQTLGAGEHTFVFTPGRETNYLMVAEAAGQRQMQKLINLSPGDGNCRLSYTGYQPTVSGMKKSRSVFLWVPGDDLRFIGFSSLGLDTIEDHPVQHTLYTFQFLHPGTPCPGIPIISDINGNVYNTVQIGNQCWLKENLKVRNYRDGTPIPNLESAALWMSATTGARCWYNNDSATYANLYGALYNSSAVDDSSGLCPAGWHVSTDLEWQTSEMHLGMSQTQVSISGWRGTNEGGKMKEAGLAHWNSPNTGATNSSGFTALPGGFRSSFNGSFYYIGQIGHWWSSSHKSANQNWFRSLSFDNNSIYRDGGFNGGGMSVRCIKD